MKKIILLVVLGVLAFGIYSIAPSEGEFEGRKQNEWVKQLNAASSKDRIKAIGALGEIGFNEYNNTSETRRSAMVVMEKMGKRCYATMVEPVAQKLTDKDEAVREAALAALLRIGPYAGYTLDQLVDTSNDQALLWGIKTVFDKMFTPKDPVSNEALAVPIGKLHEKLKQMTPHEYYAKYHKPQNMPNPSSPEKSRPYVDTPTVQSQPMKPVTVSQEALDEMAEKNKKIQEQYKTPR